MGEAKRRGTFEQRQAEAVANREERERAWNAAQAERRKQRLEEMARLEAAKPKVAAGARQRRRTGIRRAGISLAVAAMVAASMVTK